jgi:hypothetical protein
VSDPEPESMAAFQELAQLVRHFGDELASFRRRALQAEARVRALEAAGGRHELATEQQLARLEKENAELRARVATATERTRQLLDRVRFLRQQRQHEESR